MTYKISALLLLAMLMLQPVNAQQSDAGYQRVGTLDGLQLDRGVVVVNDVPYSLANNAIVHSTSAASIPLSRLRIGSKIGYKLSSSGRLITEIWVLPRNYKDPRRN